MTISAIQAMTRSWKIFQDNPASLMLLGTIYFVIMIASGGILFPIVLFGIFRSVFNQRLNTKDVFENMISGFSPTIILPLVFSSFILSIPYIASTTLPHVVIGMSSTISAMIINALVLILMISLISSIIYALVAIQVFLIVKFNTNWKKTFNLSRKIFTKRWARLTIVPPIFFLFALSGQLFCIIPVIITLPIGIVAFALYTASLIDNESINVGPN